MTRADSSAVCSADRLLFVRGTDLLAQPFDTTRLALNGNPSMLARNVATWSGHSNTFTASDDGVLAVVTGTLAGTRLGWFDRQGRRLGTVGDEGSYRNPVLSRDGTRAVIDRVDPATGRPDLWLVDLTRRVTSRLTHSPAGYTNPTWSPDGTHIACSALPGYTLAWLNLATREVAPLLRADPSNTSIGSPRDWSSDGRLLLFQRVTSSQSDLWTVSVDGNGKPRPVVQSQSTEVDGRFSPNGRWITYSTDASGRFETVIQPFGTGGQPTQISTGGGFEATWRRDGKEIFYLTPERMLMAVPVDEGPPLRLGAPQPLFEMPTTDLSDARNHYDVAADGRFLVSEVVRRATPVTITVMTNWSAKSEVP